MSNRIRQGFEDMAPDIFQQIKASPYEIIQSEEELFSELIPKKAPKTKMKKKFIYSAASFVVAAAMVLCLIPGGIGHVDAAVGEIYLDADASIILEVDENNQIIGIKAGNKDAEDIVDKMMKDTDFPASISDVVDAAITGLKEKGHDTKDILVSYCYDEKKVEAVEEAVAVSADDCTIQSFQKNEEAAKEAQRNHISMALSHFEKSAGSDVIHTAEKESTTDTAKTSTNTNTNVNATTSATPYVSSSTETKKKVKRHWRTNESDTKETSTVAEEKTEEENINKGNVLADKIKERQQKYSGSEAIVTSRPTQE